MSFRSVLRRVFRYRESRFVYRVGSLLIKALPLSKWLVVRTPYGLVVYPKDFRVLSMMFDTVEPEVQNPFEEWVREADVFVDISAGVGWYILKAHKLNPQAVKVAIEPDPIAYTVLRANLAINGLLLDSRIVTVNYACADEEKPITIKTCVSGLGIVKAEAKTLDRILRDLGLSLSPRSLILIDVEEAALEVLKGSKESLKQKPRIIVELHPGEEEVPKYLEKAGYRVDKPSKHFAVAHTVI